MIAVSSHTLCASRPAERSHEENVARPSLRASELACQHSSVARRAFARSPRLGDVRGDSPMVGMLSIDEREAIGALFPATYLRILTICESPEFVEIAYKFRHKTRTP